MQSVDPVSSTEILIPCPPAKFGEFIAGLLGRPQILSKDFYGHFEIGFEEILSFHHLIEQRVADQNVATLIECSITTSYADRSSVEVRSVDEFQAYAETRPLVPTRVSITWVYVVMFHGKSVPERQQIDVEISAVTTTSLSTEGASVETQSFLTDAYFGLQDHTGFVRTRISHTSRSWGLDILNLITTQTETFLQNDCTSLRGIIRRYSTEIGTVSFLPIFAACMTGGVFLLDHLQQPLLKQYKNLQNSKVINEASIKSRIDFIFGSFNTTHTTIVSTATLLYVIISIVVSIFIAMQIANFTNIKTPSFILLTQKSRDARSRKHRSIRLDTIIFFASFLLNVVIGVVAAIIFAKIWV